MQIKQDDAQEHEFQIAPMVDVVFMLIIFFMISAVVVSKENWELPFSLANPPGPDEPRSIVPIELAIQADGTVLFNELEIAKPDDIRLVELQTRLERAIQLFGDKQPVILSTGSVHLSPTRRGGGGLLRDCTGPSALIRAVREQAPTWPQVFRYWSC